MVLGPDDDKQIWRAWARPIFRTPLDEPAAADIVRHVGTVLDGIPFTTVILYSAMPGEIEIGRVRGRGGHRYGITRTPVDGWLTLHPVDVPHELHRYGFRQPIAGAPELTDAEVGAVIVPGLVFDRAGYRLGHGAGYYDQLFSRLPAATVRIGVSRMALVVDEIPVEPHDIPMTHLVTEMGAVEVSAR